MNADAGAGTLYADTSLLVAALAPDEVHHGEAVNRLRMARGGVICSVVADVELGRAIARRGAGALIAMARRLLAGCELVQLTDEIRETAVSVVPTSLRSLDAIHVATALVAGTDLFASFDMRQQLAAEEAGLAVAR